jgi:23S rRNA pseudouridine2605 synthase
VGEVRLQKVIAAGGVASRREAERLIAAGRVSVNGRVVRVQGVRVDPQRDEVRVDGKPVSIRRESIYLMLNKPRSVVATAKDPEGRKTVFDVLRGQASNRGTERVFHVGRLDYASEGLLLMTNDGKLADVLMHPSSRVPRVYQARVRGAPSRTVFSRLQRGIELEDGPARAREARVLKKNPNSTWVELTVLEGRNRLVRRLLTALGHPVLRLVRVGFGGLQLGDLPRGKARKLTEGEISTLKKWRKRKRRAERS